jgi:EF hand
MESRTLMIGLQLAALAVAAGNGFAAPPPGMAEPQPRTDFKAADANGDGHLSQEEFKAMGLDNLAFKAADIDGDGRVTPDEYALYLKARAEDRANPGAPDQGGGGREHRPGRSAAPSKIGRTE